MRRTTHRPKKFSDLVTNIKDLNSNESLIKVRSEWRGDCNEQDRVETLFGGFSLGLGGYAAIVAIALLVAVITGAVSRVLVQRHLARLD